MPDGVPGGNAVQADADKGWFQLLRRCRPPPSVEETWRTGEIERTD